MGSENLPHAHISGGVSNVSFHLGNDTVGKMHSVSCIMRFKTE
jgi:cobalamin-dependent methionine synthase I